MKRKAYVILLLTITIGGCFGKSPIVTTGHEGKPLPSINLLLTDSSSHVNLSNIPNDRPIVLFYFSPHCPFCRALTKEIIDDIENLRGIRIYMLSNFPLTDIKKYQIEYHMNKYSNIIIARDYEDYFRSYYKAQGIPFLAIYGKDKLLKEVVMGKVSTNLIKDVAFE